MGPFQLPGGFGDLLIFVVPQVALAIYLVLVWDARRPGSAAAGDEQIGIKTVAGALTITGVVMAATGLKELLHLLLTFDDFMPRLKAAIPDLVAGVLALVVGLLAIMPKTNVAKYPKARRLVAGAIAVGGTVATVGGLSSLLRNLLAWPSWNDVAQSFSSFVVGAVLLGAGLGALMRLSGLVTAKPASRSVPQSSAQVPAVAPPAYPPQPQAYPPQQGYPAQQGYPPQGNPPQGNPPQGNPGGAPQGWPPP